MSIGNLKHDLFSQFARVAKAMSNGYRLIMPLAPVRVAA
jgi:hypothetical protein